MLRKTAIFLTGISYDLIVVFPALLLILVNPFNKILKKYAGERLEGYKGLKQWPRRDKNITIIQCSSLGEFEQCVPLMHELTLRKKEYLVLFHSMNGYRHAIEKGYKNCFLLPFDFFIQYCFIFRSLKPSHIIICRHEFWPGFTCAAAFFRKLHPVNVIHKKRPFFAAAFFKSIYLLSEKVFFVETFAPGDTKYFFPGDTKVDRIKMRFDSEKKSIEALKENYKDHTTVLTIGNAYQEDCLLLREALSLKNNALVTWTILVILSKSYPPGEFDDQFRQYNNVKLINTYGNLFHYYAISSLVWIGGGFGKGIHNCLEGTFLKKTMISGPELNQQTDAIDAVKAGNLHIFYTVKELNDIVRTKPEFNTLEENLNESPTKKIIEELFLK